MSDGRSSAHPYIPNAAPQARKRALSEIGVGDIEDLYATIPDELRLKRDLDLPKPFLSEHALRRHVEGIVTRSRSTSDTLSFLGGGCWPHYVPAVCDEIANRGEFLTAYGGMAYSDHGKFQAMFEYQSMIGELVGMEVVSAPTYDWAGAAASAVLMAARITGRSEVLVPEIISSDKLAQMRNFADPASTIATVRSDPATGLMDLADLKAKVTDRTAAVYFENPSYLGVIELQGPEISSAAHARGAVSVVGVDPISLGVLAAPAGYGADIVCGELQPLGVHQYGGGGLAGFIASRDEERFVAEFPTYLLSIERLEDGGGWGYGLCTFERTSYEKRDQSTDYYGTTQWLWGITAAVYLSLMGPVGIREVGEGMMQRSRYAADALSRLSGVKAPVLSSHFLKEFVVNFDGAGKTVSEINKGLLARGIFGGKDLSQEFPSMGQSALYCVTEVHTRDDIDTLVEAMMEVLK